MVTYHTWRGFLSRPPGWIFTTKPPFEVTSPDVTIHPRMASRLKTSPRHGVESGVTKPPWQWARHSLSTRVVWSRAGPLAKAYYVAMVWVFMVPALKQENIKIGWAVWWRSAGLPFPLPRKASFAGLWFWRQWSEGIRWGLDFTTLFRKLSKYLCDRWPRVTLEFEAVPLHLQLASLFEPRPRSDERSCHSHPYTRLVNAG